MCYYRSDMKGSFYLRLPVLAFAFWASLRTGMATETNAFYVPTSIENSFGQGGLAVFYENQQVYPSALFAPLSSQPITITGIAFRHQEAGSSLEIVVPKLQIWLSTFSKSWDQLQRNANRNWGADRILVFDGTDVRLSLAPPTVPSEFGYQFSFERPFPYNPGAGHLVLDFNTDLELGRQLAFDAASSGVNEPGLILQGGRNGAGGGAASGVYATRFSVVVPELRTGLLQALYLAAFMIRSSPANRRVRRLPLEKILFVAICISLNNGIAAVETNTVRVPKGIETFFGREAAAVFHENQQVYNSSLFTDFGSQTIAITGIGFRHDEAGPSLEIVVPRLQIWMSTFARSWDQLQLNANRNWGPDRTLVLDQTDIRLFVTPPGSPDEFGYRFVFERPYSYNPGSGHLVLDFNTELDSGRELAFDVAGSGFEAYGLTIAGGRNGAGGGAGLGLFATTFSVVVPEPRAAILFAFALIFLTALRRYAKL